MKLVEKIMLENVSSDLVEQLQKIEEEMWLEAERVVKILEDFHSGTSTEMEE